jgi:hypothetical protein
MKKSSALLIVLISLGLFAKAQAYLGVGGFQHGKGVSGDLTLELSGRATATSNFFFGLRFQLAATPNNGYTSICITGDYYLSRPQNGLRIFAGAGFGGFNELSVTTGTADSDHFFNLNNSNFGFFPRIGIEAGRFRLSGEYDFTGGTDNYAAVNLGFFFGDGRVK